MEYVSTSNKDVNEEIDNAVNSLPEQYKIVFNLYELEGYSHKQISQLLGCSEGTVWSSLSRAKQMLRQKLLHLLKGDGK